MRERWGDEFEEVGGRVGHSWVGSFFFFNNRKPTCAQHSSMHCG